MARIATVAVAALVLVAAVSLMRREGVRTPRERVGASEAHAVPLPATLPEAAPKATALSTPPTEEIREAVASQDAARLDASLDRLIAWVGGDVRRALDVAAMMSRETDAMLLDIVADALSRDARVGEAREVVEAFLGMALRDELPARRIAALTFLEERPRDQGMEAQFLSIALGDVDSQVRTAAVCALRRQVDLVSDARARLDATLLRATASTDEFVRASAVEALSMREADAAQVARLLCDDRDAHVRTAAAEKLGEAGSTQRACALAALEESYARDADEHVQVAALVALVRAGRAEAVPALRRVAGTHREFEAVVNHLSTALASGRTDIDAVLDEATSLQEGAPLAATADEPGAPGLK